MGAFLQERESCTDLLAMSISPCVCMHMSECALALGLCWVAQDQREWLCAIPPRTLYANERGITMPFPQGPSSDHISINTLLECIVIGIATINSK